MHAGAVKTWRGSLGDCLDLLSPNFIFTGSSDGGLTIGSIGASAGRARELTVIGLDRGFLASV